MAARHLRALKSLSIMTAQAASLRGSQHAGASKKHFSSANEEIVKAITTYSAEAACQVLPPLVTANLVKYRSQLENEEADGREARFRYHRIC
jgi:hypothetical protein